MRRVPIPQVALVASDAPPAHNVDPPHLEHQTAVGSGDGNAVVRWSMQACQGLSRGWLFPAELVRWGVHGASTSMCAIEVVWVV